MNAIKEKMTSIKDTIVEGWNKAKEFLQDIDLKQIGKDIIQGLINGIKDKIKAVSDAVKDIASKITGKIKSILGIKSPSRVFMQFGEWTSEGLAIGIENMKGLAESAAEKLGASVEESFNPTLEIDSGIKKGERIASSPIDSVYEVMSLDAKGFSSKDVKTNDALIIQNENNFTVHAVIREEQDIKKLAKELNDYINFTARSKGVTY